MSKQEDANYKTLENVVFKTPESKSASSSSENSESELNVETTQQAIIQKKVPLLEPLKTNRFFLVRVLYFILRSIWIIAMIIGGFIAWIISLLFI